MIEHSNPRGEDAPLWWTNDALEMLEELNPTNHTEATKMWNQVYEPLTQEGWTPPTELNEKFVADAPLPVQQLLRERCDLLDQMHLGRYFGEMQEYYTDSSKMNGCLLNALGSVVHTWGQITKLQVLQVQRLQAIEKLLQAYAEQDN